MIAASSKAAAQTVISPTTAGQFQADPGELAAREVVVEAARTFSHVTKRRARIVTCSAN
jgi:hypothetical protein